MTRGLGLFLFVDNRSAVCFRRPAPALPSSPLRRRHRDDAKALREIWWPSRFLFAVRKHDGPLAQCG